MNDNYKDILVSIITVVRNNSDTIEHCIKSVLAQNFPNIEYIIIDGNSSDGTLEIIKKFRSKIFRVISENDKGIYDAFNKGIKIANGDIIGILNSDDFFSVTLTSHNPSASFQLADSTWWLYLIFSFNPYSSIVS